MATATQQPGAMTPRPTTMTRAMADHDHDLVHELGTQLDAVWRYDQYIANADGHTEAQTFWRERKKEAQTTVNRLRDLIKAEVKNNCF